MNLLSVALIKTAWDIKYTTPIINPKNRKLNFPVANISKSKYIIQMRSAIIPTIVNPKKTFTHLFSIVLPKNSYNKLFTDTLIISFVYKFCKEFNYYYQFSTKLVKIICVLGLGGDEKRRLSRLFL